MKIGSVIKKIRKEKEMTLDDLSAKSGVALATLSRIENGKMIGTVESHIDICKALGVSIVELYKELEEKSKVIENKNKTTTLEYLKSSNNTTFELLVSNIQDKKIMPLLLKIEPGGKTETEKNKRGVEKFIYILSGILDAKIGDQHFSLFKGDSLYFDASLTHSFKNRRNEISTAMLIVSPPEL